MPFTSNQSSSLHLLTNEINVLFVMIIHSHHIPPNISFGLSTTWDWSAIFEVCNGLWFFGKYAYHIVYAYHINFIYVRFLIYNSEPIFLYHFVYVCHINIVYNFGYETWIYRSYILFIYISYKFPYTLHDISFLYPFLIYVSYMKFLYVLHSVSYLRIYN